MLEIPLWRSGREHQSLDSRPLLDYQGSPVARVQMAPPLLVHRAVAELRTAAPSPDEDLTSIWQTIARAGQLFARAELGGSDAAEHARLVTRATGATLTSSQEAMAELAQGMERVEDALRWQAPSGDLSLFRSRRVRHPDGRGYGWVPVGQVLGFVAPSNHPAVHLTWVLALAMGWSVALRPGADDPLTPWRMLLALRAAGFPGERIALLPGGHQLVPALVEACDRTVAYGGRQLGQLIGQDRRVLFNGPGNSKVLVDGPVGLGTTSGTGSGAGSGLGSYGGSGAGLLNFLMDCIAHDGGRKCTCASAILLRGEVPGLLEDLSDRLQALPLLDPLDPAARVPVWKEAVALLQTPAQLVEADGLTFARPALIRCPDPSSPPFGLELPAPWATAAVLEAGADPMPALRGSLAVTLLSCDRELIERCLVETSIRKLFVGPVPPWHTEVGAPHQGLLSHFLYTAKAFREEEPPWR